MSKTMKNHLGPEILAYSAVKVGSDARIIFYHKYKVLGEVWEPTASPEHQFLVLIHHFL